MLTSKTWRTALIGACLLSALWFSLGASGMPYPAAPTPTPEPTPSATASPQKTTKPTPTPKPKKATPTPKSKKQKATPTPKPMTISDIKKELLRSMNEARAAAGVGQLKRDSQLDTAADIRATELIEYFSHYRPDGTLCVTVSKKARGENIATLNASPQHNTAPKIVASIMDSWMVSAPHRKNIEYPDFKTVGLGVVLHEGIYYWVQLFGV